MKPFRSLRYLLFALVLPASLCLGRPIKPFYVQVTQDYVYPGTHFMSNAGTVEKVLAVDGKFYVIQAPKGNEVRLPKKFGQKIDESRAASMLVGEREVMQEDLLRTKGMLDENKNARIKAQQDFAAERRARATTLMELRREREKNAKLQQAQVARTTPNLKLPSHPKANAEAPESEKIQEPIVPPGPLDPFENGMVVSGDGEFLGFVTRNHDDPNSLANVQGIYGSPLAPNSIFNKNGKFGKDGSDFSVSNNLALRPPRIVKDDGKWIYITANKAISPRVGMEELVNWLNPGNVPTPVKKLDLAPPPLNFNFQPLK